MGKTVGKAKNDSRGAERRRHRRGYGAGLRGPPIVRSAQFQPGAGVKRRCRFRRHVGQPRGDADAAPATDTDADADEAVPPEFSDVDIEALDYDSDYTRFMKDGVPGMGLRVDGEKYFWYHHTHADTIDKLDPREMAECVAAMAVMAYVVADMPQRLPR